MASRFDHDESRTDESAASLADVPALSRWEERVGFPLFMKFHPRLPRVTEPSTPARLAPFEHFSIPRGRGEGTLAATWFPADGEAVGAVLLLHPWLEWGQAYFHRRRRIETLREAGYHALTFDLPGFGESGPPAGSFDRDVEDALHALAHRAQGVPLYVWGVSAGGYWAHPALARFSRNGGARGSGGGVRGAFFEEVSAHLIQWGWRMSPWGFPGYLTVRTFFPGLYRFLDIRRHAAAFGFSAVTYVSGDKDPGVRPEDTRALAAAAGGESMIIPEAGHLEPIKRATREVLEKALATFHRGGEMG